ncbi:hypothetical protein GCM10007857_46090 [Bradyrhizobium iriomotense]|uniref:Lipopolysaccharide assembly protein A domain-containing protein n=1 Tax=Bradyrhizobium iriomotense TaxID=441950 RepID=A0ABQ6B0H4_9BRAD|nr:hypothetical protein GCM10007857_46090 [Bradyrhizobium iriomotense]
MPLFRLLAINLAIGACAAALLVGGLLLINPAHLRDLIFADDAPGVAIFLLLGSFLVTFGSAAMGSAIMAQAAPRIVTARRVSALNRDRPARTNQQAQEARQTHARAG